MQWVCACQNRTVFSFKSHLTYTSTPVDSSNWYSSEKNIQILNQSA